MQPREGGVGIHRDARSQQRKCDCSFQDPQTEAEDVFEPGPSSVVIFETPKPVFRSVLKIDITDERRDFSELPIDIQSALIQKYCHDFRFQGPSNAKSTETHRHKAYQKTVTVHRCSSMVKQSQCLSLRQYRISRPFTSSETEVCSRCKKTKRICARMAVEGNAYRMCLYPHKAENGDFIGA